MPPDTASRVRSLVPVVVTTLAPRLANPSAMSLPMIVVGQPKDTGPAMVTVSVPSDRPMVMVL